MHTIHPFPARMAPELARTALDSVGPKGHVLDPMCGSGTTVRATVEAGFRCVACDVDPLAVLMARVWTIKLDPEIIRRDAFRVAEASMSLQTGDHPCGTDAETQRFMSYWFATRQRHDLSRLVTVIQQLAEPMRGVLSIALSRIIVSKEMMASLARDTSHSRPHRVAVENDFNVYDGFVRSARLIAKRLDPHLITGSAEVWTSDARDLGLIGDQSIDLVLTSPPYLNAIDYLRGHRMALVWLGYSISDLRCIRSGSIGAERSLSEAASSLDISPFVIESEASSLEPRHKGWIRRYAHDMHATLGQLRRVLKQDGRVVLVLGNSFLRGAAIDNAGLVESLAQGLGFRLCEKRVRAIPARRRYLPPPSERRTALDNRMRNETVLTLDLSKT